VAWPPAEIGVMGAEGAVSILDGKDLKKFEGDVAAERARLEAEFREKFGKPYYAAASGHVDDIIAPSETRTRLIAAIDFLRDKAASLPPKKHGNIPL
jgi:propionyl-CoA carboxylase beta chain